MHLSSLPSSYGIGAMGQTAKDFVDFLQASGQSYWQLLPICPTSYGDSPYQSYSTFAGNPYFIDLDFLSEDGLLDPSEYVHCFDENTPVIKRKSQKEVIHGKQCTGP
jgi:4-alpha-glucanotransferase